MGQGANPNHQLYWTEDWFWKKRRIPPLHEACKNGYLEITIALVSCEADIEVGDGRGETAFHWACRGGHKEILVYLSQDEKCRVGKCMCVHVFWFIVQGFDLNNYIHVLL